MTTQTTPSLIPDTTLTLGRDTTVPDGIWWAVAVWDSQTRDYVDDPALGLHSGSAYTSELRIAAAPVGRRVIRYTVRQGSVTTRRGLR